MAGIFNEQYMEKLNSREWKKKRRAVIDRCQNICERCGKFQVDEVHHLTYERIFNERPEDLQGLCGSCHKLLHGDSGIDPLRPAISVQVSWKQIEYWDPETQKVRRINGAKLGRAGGFSYEELGRFLVPLEVFLDGEGNPVFAPDRWKKYQTATWRVGNWWDCAPAGRHIPADPIEARQESLDREKRKLEQVRRLVDHPEQFRSYKGAVPKTTKEVLGLFKRFPRILDGGEEWRISTTAGLKDGRRAAAA